MAKGLALVGVMLLVLSALAGCGGGKDVLRVGTEATFPPFAPSRRDGRERIIRSNFIRSKLRSRLNIVLT